MLVSSDQEEPMSGLGKQRVSYSKTEQMSEKPSGREEERTCDPDLRDLEVMKYVPGDLSPDQVPLMGKRTSDEEDVRKKAWKVRC